MEISSTGVLSGTRLRTDWPRYRRYLGRIASLVCRACATCEHAAAALTPDTKVQWKRRRRAPTSQGRKRIPGRAKEKDDYDQADQDAGPRHGWRRARHGRLRPERQGYPRRDAVGDAGQGAAAKADHRSPA